ncbi:type VI secretion system Vgr family protein [Sorangium sp. So ce861]|uniref:type VI secretion system Vgr family protein n=1 Tax=Sorangium sp. So ce861 TaxID=3133323 RepID=UPI003F5FC51C
MTFVKQPGNDSPVEVEGPLGGAARRVASRLGGKNIELEVDSGHALDVRQFSVSERLSSLFQVDLVAVSDDPSIDFDAVVGRPARFVLHAGTHDRSWSGLCNHLELVRAEPGGLSTYQLSIVPTLWLLTQRKNYRIFQQISEPDIAIKLLKEWNIEPQVRIDRGAYKKRKYRVQYAESDFAFVSRMLEDAGITYYFEQGGDETRLVLSDAPHANPRRAPPLTFLDDTSTVRSSDVEFVTSVRMGQRVRPGRYSLRDHDYRRPPSYRLMSSAASGRDVEDKLERYHYAPGAFLFGTDQGDATPIADDKGKARTDEKEAAILVQKRLDAKRGDARVCTFETNAHDLAPGIVLRVAGHPHAALDEARALLVVASAMSGTHQGEWSHQCEARGTEIPFRPALVTPKPKVNGVESATVVGPAKEEIHTDEFGRVRVHFHWDRESKMDDDSSCWIHVSQPWGGAGFGAMNLPRIGQEVLVDFLGGDPDRPVVVGRVYTNLQKVPYKLPENKTQSGWRSSSTGGTGGYNEIMFEDVQGRELVNIQAQRNLSKLVKNDETETTGANRTITVGQSRTSTIGQNDTASVGASYSVTITPPPPGGGGPPPPATTVLSMVDKQVALTTGGATITLAGPNIVLNAAESIVLGAESIVLGAKKVVQIDGTEAVYINCTKPPPDPIESAPSFLAQAAMALLCPPLFAVQMGVNAIQSAMKFFSR